MCRAIVLACLPWLGLLAGALMVLGLLARLGRARLKLSRLRILAGDERGGVQSLSFVLTLPFFVMILLFIVQVSQLMIGTIVVHYAAFAAARSAIVWIPARLSPYESENCISSYVVDSEAPQNPPVLDPESPNYGPAAGGMNFIVAPGSEKYAKIASAAVLACMAISPSRDLGIGEVATGTPPAEILKAAYAAMAPGSSSNLRVPARLANKLAYAATNTRIEIRFYHKNSEPPLVTHLVPPDIAEFRDNELGWQDQVTVTVRHDLAMLPGPGRLLARYVPGPSGVDAVSTKIFHQGKVYAYPLRAQATLVIEGEKAVVPYEYYRFY
jgi:hypothetical protein